MPEPFPNPLTEPQEPFLRACLSLPVERTPIWIMRQAGRYLPEYREIRSKWDFLTSCRTPEIACEITLQPIRRLGVDAAILFADILLPLPGMGVPVEFNPGPVIANPVRARSQIEALRVTDAREATAYVMEAVRLTRRELDRSVPLIGFGGAPFTLATYLVEGGGSKSFAEIKSLLFSEPETAHLLLAKCADTLASYLSEQVRAGAQAAMLFDTWAGILSPGDYRTFALPYARRVFEAVEAAAPAGDAAGSAPAGGGEDARPHGSLPAPGAAEGDLPHGARGARAAGRARVPRIYYAGDAAGHLEALREIEAEVIGLDWRLGLDGARRRLGRAVAVQGNLDPGLLLGPPSLIERRAREVLVQARAPELGAQAPARASEDGLVGPATGHIFNLGHGILPQTPPESALFLVETVHRLGARGAA